MNAKQEEAKTHQSLANKVRQAREDRMMSKAELARKAGLTVQTIDRIERGHECRLATKRKIILALGYDLADRTKIFVPSDTHDDEHIGEDSSDMDSSDIGSHLIGSEKERMRILRKKAPMQS